MKRIGLFLTSLLAVFAIAFVGLGFLPSANAFNPLKGACTGSAKSSGACTGNTAGYKAAQNPVVTAIADATRILSLVIGFAAIIIIVVSGIGMITSAGNAESVTNAKKRLTGAIVGLAIAALAWILSSYLIGQLL